MPTIRWQITCFTSSHNNDYAARKDGNACVSKNATQKESSTAKAALRREIKGEKEKEKEKAKIEKSIRKRKSMTKNKKKRGGFKLRERSQDKKNR